MGKRILVTGGAGFIGSNLCRKLLAAGDEVICVDNFFTGSRRNIADLLDNPYFEVLRDDVTFRLYVEVDLIYNLARPHRCTTSSIPFRRPRPAWSAPSTCWASSNGPASRSSKLRRKALRRDAVLRRPPPAQA